MIVAKILFKNNVTKSCSNTLIWEILVYEHWRNNVLKTVYLDENSQFSNNNYKINGQGLYAQLSIAFVIVLGVLR